MNTMKFLATAGVVLTSALAMAETEVRFANEWDQVLEEEIVTAVPVENANKDVAAFKMTDMEEVWRIKNNPVDMEEAFKVRENPAFASVLRANESWRSPEFATGLDHKKAVEDQTAQLERHYMPEENQAKTGIVFGLDLAKKDFGKEGRAWIASSIPPRSTTGAVLTPETEMQDIFIF